MMAQPTNADSLITGTIIPKNSAVKIMPKILSFKLVKPQPPSTSVVTHTTDLTQYLTTVPLINKSSASSIQHENPSITTKNSTTSSMQHTDTIVRSVHFSTIDSDPSKVVEQELITDGEKENDSVFNSDGHFIWNHRTVMLFFSEYIEHEKKFGKGKYHSKEAMFQALAESFQRKGYVSATKNHMKNKFKLLKKKWDNHIKRTIGKNSSGKGTKFLPYEEDMIKIFGKSCSGVPLFVASRNGIISQQEILQNISQNVPENENKEKQEISSHSLLSPATLDSDPLSSRSNSSSVTSSNSVSVPILSANSNISSMTNRSCSSSTNKRVKARDGKLALTLQSIKDSICAMLQTESDSKQETRIKYLSELQKYNELQTERNNIMQKQLMILENLTKKIQTEKELSSDKD